MPYPGPLLTSETAAALRAAHAAGAPVWSGSLDLGRSRAVADLRADGFGWAGRRWPWPEALRERTIHYWNGAAWAPVQRFDSGLYKLVPTAWGPPTFEIDGIKMLPTARVSPWDDAASKAALVEPHGKRILDTCGGLGYFAAACHAAGAADVRSFEKSATVLWLRGINPWSPDSAAPEAGGRLTLVHGDIAQAVAGLPDACFDACLHDPPRFGVAGELYAQSFYGQLARVLRPGARMFHYTGAPNGVSHGRDLAREVALRLERSGFQARRALDGILAIRGRAGAAPRG